MAAKVKKETPLEELEASRAWLLAESRRAAIKAWERCTFHGYGARCHLFYKVGALELAPEDGFIPEGMTLAEPRALSIGSRSIDQIAAEVHKLAQRCACLPVADAPAGPWLITEEDRKPSAPPPRPLWAGGSEKHERE